MKLTLYNSFVLLPLKKTKAPDINTWRDLSLEHKCSYDLIEKSEYIGLICGHDGVEVIDVDNHFGDADDLFQQIYENYDFSDFPIVKTMNGGYHIYIRSSDPRGNLKFASRRVIENDETKHEIDDKGNHYLTIYKHNKVLLKKQGDNWQGDSTLVESRGIGGYVVCPPSPNYTVIQGDLTNIPLLSEKQRGTIISICQSLNEIPKEEDSKTTSSGTDRPGDMYNSDSSNIEVTKTILRNNGWSTNNEKNWTRPGKEIKDGFSATFGKVGENKFYVFSSNAHPFESQKSYSMFAVKAILEFNGDYSACAKAIAPDKQTKKKEEKPKVSTEECQQYLRIGDNYYKNISVYDKNGNKIERISKRARQTLIDDFGKPFLSQVQKFDDFVNIPSHLNYERIKGNCYNMYQEVETISKKGDFPLIQLFIEHIFGSNEIEYKGKKIKEYELGFDYIQILYKEPTMILPVLCLVSKENETGKTTFGNFLNCIFGGNFVMIGQQELKTEFNGSYASKLVAMVDEGWIDYKIIDKLKQLSTAPQIMLRQMHRDHATIDFFCKWILCSNRTKDFIVASENDERYWVREISKFKKFDPNFLGNLKKEIPYFLDFILTRELSTDRDSRMHFDKNLIKTDAFLDVIRHSIDSATKDFVGVLLETLEESKLLSIDCSIKDLKERFFDRRNDISHNKIKDILQEHLKLKPRPKPTYYLFFDNTKSKTGRFYTIDIETLKSFINISYDMEQPIVYDGLPDYLTPNDEELIF